MASTPPRKRPRLARSNLTTTSSTTSTTSIGTSKKIPVPQDADDETAEIAMDLFYRELRKRFTKIMIYVDQIHKIPQEVLYPQVEYPWVYQPHEQDQETTTDLTYSKYELKKVSSAFGGAVQQFVDKFRKPTKKIQAYLELVDLHVDHLEQFLTLEETKNSRVWILAPRKHRLVVDGPLQTLGLTYEAAAVLNFVRDLRVAFTEEMHNSVGRRGLVSILEFAGRVAFRHDFHKSTVQIIQLGSSPYPVEGFPVAIMESSQVASKRENTRLRSPSSVRSSVSGDVLSTPSVSTGTSASTGKSSKSSKSKKKKIVFSDIAVASVHDKGGVPWVKILMVCEVKSGYEEFSVSETGQLVRQMVAACMHQSEVFGLMINAGYAKLVRLRHHPEKKVLTCDDLVKDQYMFATHEMDSNDKSFQGSELKRLVRDLAAVLDYANEKICFVEVEPANVKPSDCEPLLDVKV